MHRELGAAGESGSTATMQTMMRALMSRCSWREMVVVLLHSEATCLELPNVGRQCCWFQAPLGANNSSEGKL